MGSAGLKECQGFRNGFDFSGTAGQGAGFEAGCGGYGYNATYVGGRHDLHGIGDEALRRSARIDEIHRPAETIMFTDSAYVTGTGTAKTKIEYSFCEPPFHEYGPYASYFDEPGTFNPTIDFRHLKQTNVAWTDGHADSHSMDFTDPYTTHGSTTADELKRLGVGWFGPRSNMLFSVTKKER